MHSLRKPAGRGLASLLVAVVTLSGAGGAQAKCRDAQKDVPLFTAVLTCLSDPAACFGAARPPCPPVPPPPPFPPQPPPPPPPPPPPAYEAKQFILYFPFDQFVIDAVGQTIIGDAANYATAGAATRIVIVGHADTSGGAAYNVRLSERRAKAIADSLVGAGIGADAIVVDWKGETEPAVPTGDGVKEPLNRRATIDINF